VTAPSKPLVTPKQGVLAGALAAAVAVAGFVAPWEGESLTPYRDVVGVWTWCNGITRGTPKERYTREECQALLRDEVAIHLRGVAKCIHQPLKQNEWVAIGSWTYNVGVGAACNSTLVRKINAGVPWCAELLKWDRAGGRKVRGLTRRRQAEFEVCEGRA
jgi:lysozyme